MKKTLLLISICLGAGHLSAQTTYSKEVEEQIKQVENNLAGRVKIDGKTYNILERMVFQAMTEKQKFRRYPKY